jgi:hypothetical protein
MSVPVDPMTLAIAIALAEVNQKLDTIIDLQREMLDYMRIKDKAVLRGNLECLQNIADTYRFNRDSDAYKTAQLQKAVDIKQESYQSVIAVRSLILKNLDQSNLVEIRTNAGKDADELLDLLKDYQLSLHLFSYASFIEVLLLENFEPDYLAKVSGDIRTKALQYRELYTGCYNELECRTEKSVESKLLGGVSKLGKELSSAVAKTPIGDKTQIDETLDEVGSRLESFNLKKKSELKNRLIAAKDPGVLAYAESVEAVAQVFNGNNAVLTDGEAFYLVPEE